MNPGNLPHQLNRHQITQFLDMSGIDYLLGSWSAAELISKIGRLTEPLNQSFEDLLVSSQHGQGFWEEQGYEWLGGI